jgi:hypothetical protein
MVEERRYCGFVRISVEAKEKSAVLLGKGMVGIVGIERVVVIFPERGRGVCLSHVRATWGDPPYDSRSL